MLATSAIKLESARRSFFVAIPFNDIFKDSLIILSCYLNSTNNPFEASQFSHPDGIYF
jgi:hypothetical protein